MSSLNSITRKPGAVSLLKCSRSHWSQTAPCVHTAHWRHLKATLELPQEAGPTLRWRAVKENWTRKVLIEMRPLWGEPSVCIYKLLSIIRKDFSAEVGRRERKIFSFFTKHGHFYHSLQIWKMAVHFMDIFIVMSVPNFLL